MDDISALLSIKRFRFVFSPPFAILFDMVIDGAIESYRQKFEEFEEGLWGSSCSSCYISFVKNFKC